MATNNDVSCEMFIDITPGTPPIWREEVFKKLFLSGYDIKHNVIFGVDSMANDYSNTYASKWMKIDDAIYKKLRLVDDDFINSIYHENLLRFLGKTDKVYTNNAPLVGI